LYYIILLVLILSVTLSTTATWYVWWKSTEYGEYDIAINQTWSISSTRSCYNTLQTYRRIDGVTSYYTWNTLYKTYTTMTRSSATWSSISTMYFTTTQSYTTIYSYYTIGLAIINTYLSYIVTYLHTDYVTFTDTDILVSFSTDVQYSTITMMMAPSPSIVPKNKCTCNIPLCNKLDLVLLTINNIVY
jgi:hypothetical protein